MIQFVEEEILVPVQLQEILTTEEVKAYRRPAAWRQAFDFGLVWAQIFAGVALFVWSPGILTYIAAVLLIGWRSARTRTGCARVYPLQRDSQESPAQRFPGNLLFGAPGGLPYSLFRHRHFLHHRHYSTERDTKVIYRRDIRGINLWIELVKKLVGFDYFSHVFLVLRRMKSESGLPAAGGPGLLEILPPMVITHIVIFAAFWLIHPLAYFFLYLVPLLTVNLLFTNFRAITEHQPPRSLGGMANSGYFLGTAGPFVRTVGANLFDRVFLCKINFGYHVEHHLWPQINYQFLPAVHQRLLEHDVFADPRFWPGNLFHTKYLEPGSSGQPG